MKYGEKIVNEFDVEKDLEIWPNQHKRDYLIKMTLPEFSCLCPRSGYPDYATIYLEYTPDEWVVELKAIKLYINSFYGMFSNGLASRLASFFYELGWELLLSLFRYDILA